MKTVYKYPLDFEDYSIVTLPLGYQLLKVIIQNGNPVLYALIDTNENRFRGVRFRIAGTGHPIDEDNLEYVSTFEMGSLVFHVFHLL